MAYKDMAEIISQIGPTAGNPGKHQARVQFQGRGVTREAAYRQRVSRRANVAAAASRRRIRIISWKHFTHGKSSKKVTKYESNQTGSKFSLFDDSIRTYDQLPAVTFELGYSQQEGCYLLRRSNTSVTEKVYGVQQQKVDKVLTSFERFERSLGVILSGDKGIGKSMFAKCVCRKGHANGISCHSDRWVRSRRRQIHCIH